MPKRVQVIPELQKAVTRPIVFDIAHEMLLSAGIDPNTPVRYKANGEAIPNSGSTLGRDTDPASNPTRLPTDQIITIDVTEDYNESCGLSESVMRPNQPLIFADTKLHVYMKPYYKNQNVEFQVSFRAGDLATAQRWRTRMKLQASRGIQQHLHTVQYHYVIPRTHMQALIQIHLMREAQYGYGESLEEWLDKCFTPNYTVASNMAGRGAVYSIREGHTGIMGTYDFGHNPPKPEREGDAGGYVMNFSYKFNYDRVEGIVMQYPMMVHNQPLPPGFYDLPDYPQWYEYFLNANDTTRWLDKWRWSGVADFPALATPGVSVPYFDDWLPSYQKPNFQKVLQIQLQCNPNNLREVISIPAMGEWTLLPIVQQYLQLAPRTAFQLYQSVFNFEIHRYQALTDPENVIVTNNLDIMSITDLDPRSSYHFVISMLLDPTLLSQDALKRLAQNSCFAKLYLGMLWPGILQVWPDDPLCGPMPLNILRNLIQQVGQRVPVAFPNPLAMWCLVLTATIQAERAN